MKQTGTVEEYTNRFVELLRKIDPDDKYPQEYRIRIYKKGLSPEIQKWVNLNADQSDLDNIYEIAKKVEETDCDPVEQTYHQTQAQPTAEWSALAKVLQDLTSRLDRVEQTKRNNNWNNNNNQQQSSRNNKSGFTCYNCGGSGHARKDCPSPAQSQKSQNNN